MPEDKKYQLLRTQNPEFADIASKDPSLLQNTDLSQMLDQNIQEGSQRLP